ncbi:branched-chain amino acid ABC transporter permease [Rhodovulum sp. NI22]|uniref:Branched-chain amino acid transport system permease protein n=1 Tax=Actibacterium naphthalenivorans TaxID=1614693 RepID=A0A840CFW3_9RHOB|nr:MULTISPECIES: branched-chain amino acid ABC transporter permease [Actibacterium]ALG89319.1 branched-chain amino acid ABC transporter permease [Actibacterium sp. EMB200-NS6]KGB83125.1 branched-chain amino acid ABC transporter permease [Rhodovulum sp. NI22]MBB4021077.1 branched-chain amino acid transport system permease protein [Actibacterium naphthalenivorans]
MLDPYILQQLAIGLSLGMIYALMAIGFTLIFGVLNVVNFAHGEIYTIGAFAGLMVISVFGPPLLVVLFIALATGALAGFGLERLAFRPFRRFSDEASLKSRAMREATLMSSLAMSIIAREAMEMIFGSQFQSVDLAYLINKPIGIGPITIVNGDLIIFGITVVMLGGLQWLLKKSPVGLSIRAVSNNALGAKYCGINTDRTIIITFVIGSAMGALAGILVGLYYGAIFPSMGFTPGIKAFVAMVMGGLSSIPGAVISAIILGLSESLSTSFMSSVWSDMVAYAFLLLTLIFFPQGLFGARRERV